ncbi:O-acetylhomoserine aminocarboxypropyltransferase/cysteine synthase family protein [Clostridium sp.]|uniref:O-acetylhomoserine aminocarboxypropyltransferase/cysteine synthase family protein n=1 Tax=Clostridium sp. TaxID=1506 RepID=UPI002FC74FEB
MREFKGIGTKCIQGGYSPKEGEPRIMPIVQSTTYKYDDPDTVAGLFDLTVEGHMYSRISNPTVEALEKKIALLEGGVGALAVSSGQAATLVALHNICHAGDHIVAASTLYGGTHTLLGSSFKKIGIDVTFVNPDASVEEIKKEFKDNTKALFGETIGNPNMNILDFEKFKEISTAMDVPLIIDNTLATPYLCRPIEHGADIVIHSATKFIDGHATSVGGVIVDSGRFNWNNGKFKGLSEADPSYHGLVYTETFKESAYIVKARVHLLRDFGTTLSPFNAFLMNLGCETLHLRMERHCKNALSLAKALKEHNKVKYVNYPGLDGDNNHKLANKYLENGYGAVLTFGINGTLEDAKKFIKSLEVAALVVHLGDARTSVIHPASTTHRQLSREQQIKAGAHEDLIRVSVGIEDEVDIIEDFYSALDSL